jgi:transcriptional regulator with XRE-family HTH domain
MATFPQRLTELRNNRKLTVKDLAAELGVSRQTISAYERGESVPDITLFVIMADYFGVPADYLLGRDSHSKDKKKLPLPHDFKDYNYTLMMEVAAILHEKNIKLS